MTAADIPLTTVQTGHGGEGMRFIGDTVYSALIPGLAKKWSVDARDKIKWTCKIREGATFHGGSAVKAPVAVWNFEKLLVDDSEQYASRQAAQAKSRIPAVAS